MAQAAVKAAAAAGEGHDTERDSAAKETGAYGSGTCESAADARF
jgi:hypothetical protein